MKYFRNSLFGLVLSLLAACTPAKAVVMNVEEYENDYGQKIILLHDVHAQQILADIKQMDGESNWYFVNRKARIKAQLEKQELQQIESMTLNLSHAHWLIENMHKRLLECDYEPIRNAGQQLSKMFLPKTFTALERNGVNVTNIETRHPITIGFTKLLEEEIQAKQLSSLAELNALIKSNEFSQKIKAIVSSAADERLNYCLETTSESEHSDALKSYFSESISMIKRGRLPIREGEVPAAIEVLANQMNPDVMNPDVLITQLEMTFMALTMKMLDMEAALQMHEKFAHGEELVVVHAGALHNIKIAQDVLPILGFEKTLGSPEAIRVPDLENPENDSPYAILPFYFRTRSCTPLAPRVLLRQLPFEKERMQRHDPTIHTPSGCLLIGFLKRFARYM